MTFIPPKEDLASQIGVLYKYVKIDNARLLVRAKSMIKDKSLWFWHVTGQNDKNECKPFVFFGGDGRARYNYFKKDFKEAFPNHPSKYLEKQARKAARKPTVPAANKVYDYWAICCFTTKGNSPDLWKEYAGKGAGIVIEYEAKEGLSIGLASKITYSNKKIKLDILKITEEVCYNIITTKTKRWEHEEEYRMTMRLGDPKIGQNFFFNDVKILSVRLGENLGLEYSKTIQKLCTKNHIPVYQQ